MAESRNLVVCMDGTGNAPKASGNTNVLRLFGMLEHEDPQQLTFYSQGVGTRGDPGALTGFTRWLTRMRGAITGYGMRRDVADAYTFLVQHYRDGDRIFVFGFSRGAFAALALTGALRVFGLVRPTSSNMIAYVVDGIAKTVRKGLDVASYKFSARFARRSAEPVKTSRPYSVPVHFVGLWDTVKALKYFKLRTAIREGWLREKYHESWPKTSKPDSITTLRHAVCIDDRRSPYDVFSITPTDDVDFHEVWFAGVHSDVGGGFEQDPELGAITLKWMIEAALDKGLLVRDGEYERYCSVDVAFADGKIHRNSYLWYLVGWRRRLARRPFKRRFYRTPRKWFEPPPAETLHMHQSVLQREDYVIPEAGVVVADDLDWTASRPGGYAHARPG